MNRPKRSEDKYWQGTRNFDHIQFEEDLEEYISELEEQEALRQPPVMGRSEQLTAFAEWLKDNHSIEIHDMILKDYIRWGG